MVKPPRMPVVRNSRSGWLQPASGRKASQPAISPMTSEPTTFTASVPQGKRDAAEPRAADIDAVAERAADPGAEEDEERLCISS